MRYQVVLTNQTVYEIEAATPEDALGVATGEAAQGEILSQRLDHALPEVSPAAGEIEA